jgi:hypothetical protein
MTNKPVTGVPQIQRSLLFSAMALHTSRQPCATIVYVCPLVVLPRNSAIFYQSTNLLNLRTRDLLIVD